MRKPIGGPELRKHAVPGAFALRRVFDRNQRRAAPFAAKPNALHETQSGERPWREHACARVGRQHADQRRREPHGQHGGDERRFAADAIAKMAEQERAHGSREEGEAECQIGVEGLRFGRGFREEHRPEHERRRGAENIEVVELDRRADEAGQRDLADARALSPIRKRRHCRFLKLGCWRRDLSRADRLCSRISDLLVKQQTGDRPLGWPVAREPCRTKWRRD